MRPKQLRQRQYLTGFKEQPRTERQRQKPIFEPQHLTKTQVTQLLQNKNTDTDNHIYIIAIFLKTNSGQNLFIKSSTPFTLSVNNTNINIKGADIVFFNTTGQLIEISNIPEMIFNDNDKIIRMRMRDIHKSYDGLDTSQYVECKTISFSDDSTTGSNPIFNYTLDGNLLQNTEINTKINNEAETLRVSIKDKYDNSTIQTENDQPTTEKSLPSILITFRKYIEYLYRIPFMYKLNALTPDNVNELYQKKFSIKTSGAPKIEKGEQILKELINFSYIKLTFDDNMNTELTYLLLDENQTQTYSQIINKDTEIYNLIILNTTNESKYIHILHFINLIEEVWEKVFSIEYGQRIPTYFDKFYSNVIKNILERNQQIEQIYKKLNNINNNPAIYPDIQDGNTGIPLRVHVDRLLSEKNSKDFITYLKINNTEGNANYNQRYCLQLNQILGIQDPISTSMLLNYNAAHNFPYYTKAETGVETSTEIDKMKPLPVQFQQIDGTKRKQNDDLIIENYDNQYVFGHYNRIFPVTNNTNSPKNNTNSPNSVIAKQMPEIIKQICENEKPVFMLGYGASGSGKTSSLIHLNKGNGQTENGVVVHLCEEIVKKGIYKTKDQNGTEQAVKGIQVRIYEKYNDDSDVVTKDDTCETCDEHTTTTKKPIKFKVVNEQNGNIKFITNYQTQPTRGAAAEQSNSVQKESTQIYDHSDNVNIRNGINECAYILSGKELGEVLKELVDVDRLVRATTNNRQSSRSHVLICIHFYKDENYTPANYLNSLIVGDLAGKENVFKCTDVNTILSFLNEKIGDGSPNEGKPFYSVLESIKTIEETDPAKYSIEKQKHKNRIGNNKPVFSFTNPDNYFKNYSNNVNKNFIKPIIRICLKDRQIVTPDGQIKDEEIYKKIYNDDTNTQFQPTLSFMNILNAYKENCIYKPEDEKVQLSIQDMCKKYLKQRQAWFSDSESDGGGSDSDGSDSSTSGSDSDGYDSDGSDSSAAGSGNRFSIFEILYLTLYENGLYKQIETVYNINKATNKNPFYIEQKPNPNPNDPTIHIENRKSVCESLDKQSKLMYNKIKHPSKPKIIKIEYKLTYIKQSIYQLITYHLLYIIEATNTKISKATVNKIITHVVDTSNSNTQIRYDKLINCFNKNEIPIDIAQDVIFTIKYEIRKLRDTPTYKNEQFTEDINFNIIEKLVNSGIFITNNQEQSDEIPASTNTDLLPINLLSIMINDFVFYDKRNNRMLSVDQYDKYFNELMNQKQNIHYRPDHSEQIVGGSCKDKNDPVTQKSSLFPSANKLPHYQGIDIKEIDTVSAGSFKTSAPSTTTIKSKLLNEKFTNVILQCLAATNWKQKSPKEFYTTHKDTFHATLTEIKKNLYANNPAAYWYKNTETDKTRLVNNILTAIINIKKNENVKQDFNVFIIHKLDNSENVIPIHKEFKIDQLCKFLYTKYVTILSPYFDTYHKTITTDRGYTLFFNDIFKSMKDHIKTDFYEYIDLFKKIDDIISETTERIHYGTEICNERVTEGTYINNSLDTMRKTIKKILTEKHKASQALFSSPTFVDQCLKSYCPTGINCFNTYNAEKENSDKEDSLFEEIFKDLKQVKGEKKYELDGLYKEIVLCIFGVFNISRLADNPPKVPYIDINNLKRLFYNNNVSIQKLAPKELIKTQTLLKQLPMITLDDIRKNITDYFEAAKTKTTVESLKEKLGIIIKKIDLHNASSSIGTLETVNTIAMLGNVDTLCDKQSIYHNEFGENLYTRSHDYQPNHTCKPPTPQKLQPTKQPTKQSMQQRNYQSFNKRRNNI